MSDGGWLFVRLLPFTPPSAAPRPSLRPCRHPQGTTASQGHRHKENSTSLIQEYVTAQQTEKKRVYVL